MLPDGSTVTLNDRGAYAVEDNNSTRFTCVGVLNDANIEMNHSMVDLTAGVDQNNGLPSNSGITVRSELPYGPIVVAFAFGVIDGNLTCRSRMSGRELSVYIGGKYISSYNSNTGISSLPDRYRCLGKLRH